MTWLFSHVQAEFGRGLVLQIYTVTLRMLLLENWLGTKCEETTVKFIKLRKYSKQPNGCTKS